MFTDMVGYTSSAQVDEARTLETLQEIEELIRPVLVTHEGRAVKATGDGFLVEFSSALKATRCAIDIQRRMRSRNEQASLGPIQIRIGIHLGDVEQRGSDILGDAVNIAARIEPMAEPGGICVSGAVREQVWNKIADLLERLPPRPLKGLRTPPELYRVVLPWTVRRGESQGSDPTRLAVLPFLNMSPDVHDEYFADGLTEEIITELSRVSGLRVVARTSVMRYKGSSRTVEEIGRDLHVGAVLEGSVRRAGSRIRITAQLIDSGSQEHVWAEQFDRKLVDIFEIQTEIAKNVAGSLGVKLGRIPGKDRPPTRDMEAYSLYLKGRSQWNTRASPSVEAALESFKEAVTIDPAFSQAYSGIADCYSVLLDRNEIPWVDGGPKAMAAALRAVELNPDLAEAHASLGFVFDQQYEWDSGEREIRRAIELAPSYATAHHWYHMFLAKTGRFDEADEEISRAEEADPASPAIVQLAAMYCTFRGRDEDALRRWDRALELGGALSDWILFSKAIFYLRRNRREEALATARMFDELTAKGGIASEIDRIWIPGSLHAALGNREEGVRALGLLTRAWEEGKALAGEIVPLCAALDEPDLFYEWLFRALESRTFNLYGLRIHPLYERMRADPRFEQALRRYRIQQ